MVSTLLSRTFLFLLATALIAGFLFYFLHEQGRASQVWRRICYFLPALPRTLICTATADAWMRTRDAETPVLVAIDGKWVRSKRISAA